MGHQSPLEVNLTPQFFFFLIGGLLPYNIVLVSAIQQRESALGIQTSPPLKRPSHLPPHSIPLGCHRAPWVIQRIFTGSHFVHVSMFCVHASLLLSPFIPHSPSPTVSTHLFSTSVSPLLPCKWVCQYHLSRFHMRALIYDIHSV